ADTLAGILLDARVTCRFIRQDGFPTITKQRVLSQHQQLLRLDYEACSGAAAGNDLFAAFLREVKSADIAVLSDYAKGSLNNVQTYINECRTREVKVLVDPKGTDFSRYHGANLLTPNLRELEMVVGPCVNFDSLVEKGQNLCTALGLEALLVTRGDRGMTLVRQGEAPVHLTTEAREVFDVTGAGDTVIATMAACLASGHDYVQAMSFANRAAGLVVAKLGTASVTVNELNNSGSGMVRNAVAGIPDEKELLNIVAQIRKKGGTVVMTNGCFDILHAGHVRYLNQARQLGDCLIVAVNDDDSVTRLKGEGRPVNPLRHRLEVLHALKFVDCAVPFSEDTPERLIRLVAPDVLVKGGDYREEDIAGAGFVKQSGGSVRILPLYGGYSTTKIINSAKSEEPRKK
ncbi:MAG: bifunctional D-glycero-beta-D-manno-heptose-7-phosphate kinase/D-glycero-beta-D-manno-heptose 1-phosphate adenylyltransferase HldE, partial [Gammaproteobacteria bacterium]